MSAENPCPVCKKPDYCVVAPDGSAPICGRVESAKRCGGAGWLHRLSRPGQGPTGAGTKRPARRPTDWAAVAAKYAAKLTPERRGKLAAKLGLPPDALDVLPLLGFNPDDMHGACFTFPDVDPVGRVVGLLRRFGQPVSINGGKPTNKAAVGGRGLTLPEGWRDRAGPVLAP